MSVAAIEKDRISVEDYLAGERDGEVRHEYVAGQVYAMTGASRRHGLIVNALALALTPSVRGVVAKRTKWQSRSPRSAAPALRTLNVIQGRWKCCMAA